MENFNAEDEVFEKKLEDKKHRDMMKLFRELLTSLQRQQDSNMVVKEAIDANSKNMQLFFEKLKDITKTVEVKSPDVNVEVNQKEVVSELKVIAQSMMRSFHEMQIAISKPKSDWEFFVNRGSNGFIESVTAIQK